MTHCSQGPILVESTGTGTVSMRSSEHKIPFDSVPNLGERREGEREGGWLGGRETRKGYMERERRREGQREGGRDRGRESEREREGR